MAVSGWSNEDIAQTTLSGTWIQDPLDPGGTVVHFRYGGIGRQESLDRAKTAMQFAGRAFPVYDVGEAQAESVNVTVQLNGEESSTKADIARTRKFGREANVILYRDGRGRKLYGMMSDFSMTDQEMGSVEVSFVVSRVDYDEALPGVT